MTNNLSSVSAVLSSYLNFSFVLLAKIEVVVLVALVVAVIVAIFVELKVGLVAVLKVELAVEPKVVLAVVLRAGLVVGQVVVAGWLASVLEIIIHLNLIHSLLSEVVAHFQHSNDILDYYEQPSFTYYLVLD